MTNIKEQSSLLDSSWILGEQDDKAIIKAANFNLCRLKNYHTVGIDFLHQNFKRKFTGSIINAEKELNPQLQASVFLNRMLKFNRKKSLVLVLAPDHFVINWHYHLTLHGELTVKIIMFDTDIENFNEADRTALLLPFSSVKLAERLIQYRYSVVIIDQFDEVANKSYVRRLSSSFNIGLTERNFYRYPDQKLQWIMLQWCNPGCAGRLCDFYMADNKNFVNRQDNYRFWWLRLTWNLCESFCRDTIEEIQLYNKELSEWAISHKLQSFGTVNQRKHKIISGNNEDCQTFKIKRTGDNGNRTDRKLVARTSRRFILPGSAATEDAKCVANRQQNSDSVGDAKKKEQNCEVESCENIQPLHEPCIHLQQEDSVKVKPNSCTESYIEYFVPKSNSPGLESSLENRIKNESNKCCQKDFTLSKSNSPDENPFLSFLNYNDEVKVSGQSPSAGKVVTSDSYGNDTDNGILMSIIEYNEKRSTIPEDKDTELFYKKEEILSQIYDTDDKPILTEGSSFLQSFIHSD